MPAYPATPTLGGSPTAPCGKAAWRDRATTGQPQLVPLSQPGARHERGQAMFTFQLLQPRQEENQGHTDCQSQAPDLWSRQTTETSAAIQTPEASSPGPAQVPDLQNVGINGCRRPLSPGWFLRRQWRIKIRGDRCGPGVGWDL